MLFFRRPSYKERASLFTMTLLAGCSITAGTGAPALDGPSTGESLRGEIRPLRTVMGAAVKSHALQNLYLFGTSGSTDGATPNAGLYEGENGALFGTTEAGGQYGYGSVFKLTPNGPSKHVSYTETIVYSFAGSAEMPQDGEEPMGTLVSDSNGTLYGTTYYGGGGGCGAEGCGTVFALTPTQSGTYVESVLYRFRGTAHADGSHPSAGLTPYEGILYGTTLQGGTVGQGHGTIFSLTPTSNGYNEFVLYSFPNDHTYGGAPNGAMVVVAGALYGTASTGGSNLGGLLFSEPLSGGTPRVVGSFGFSVDGATPEGALIASQPSGPIYGTTSNGGRYGVGIAYEMPTSGGPDTPLYNFKGPPDGSHPVAGLTFGRKKGLLYGVTSQGGTGSCSGDGCGTLFELVDSHGSYTEKVLANFDGGSSSGAFPSAEVVFSAGNIYGTASSGGIYTSACATGCGLAFEYP